LEDLAGLSIIQSTLVKSDLQKLIIGLKKALGEQVSLAAKNEGEISGIYRLEKS
jgi:hypothetical protein